MGRYARVYVCSTTPHHLNMHTAIQKIAFLAILAAVAIAAGESAGEPAETTPAFTEAYNDAVREEDIVGQVTNLLGAQPKESTASNLAQFGKLKKHAKKAAKKISKHVSKAKKFVKSLKAKVLKHLKRATATTVKKVAKHRSALAKALAKSSAARMLAKKRKVRKVGKGSKRATRKKKAKGLVRALEGHVDDDEDRTYFRKNSVGANRLTGTKTYRSKYENGLLRPPGYVTGDSSLGPHGHYYIGPSRRRIGAGYGRRRRTKTFPKRVLKKAKKSMIHHKITSGYHRIKKTVRYSFTKKTIVRVPK